jgi:dTDP-4-dehydrorhamnose 3,5-epimerase
MIGDFFKAGIGEHLVQGTYSRSTKGTLSGLHYQRNHKAQGKIVSCVKGRIYDVTADIRKRSSYYKKWSGVELTEENKYLLYVPPGYAHGFLVIIDSAEVMYMCTE